MRDCDGVELAGNQQFALIANQTKGNTMSQSTIPPELALKIQDSQQSVGREPDGPGRRIGKVGEFTFIAPLKAGGAEKFRQRLATSQARAGYYEGQLGTVHDLRIVLFYNDTRLLFAATYDSDFQPYLADVIAKAAPWLDEMFLDILEGYPGANDPHVTEYIANYQIEADLWFTSHPDMTAKDIAKGEKMMKAFETLLDAASG